MAHPDPAVSSNLAPDLKLIEAATLDGAIRFRVTALRPGDYDLAVYPDGPEGPLPAERVPFGARRVNGAWVHVEAPSPN